MNKILNCDNKISNSCRLCFDFMLDHIDPRFVMIFIFCVPIRVLY